MNNIPNEHHSNPPTNASPSPLADVMKEDYWAQAGVQRESSIPPKDPGTKRSRIIAIICTIMLVASVVIWQNTDEEFKFNKLLGKPAPTIELTAEKSAPGNFGSVDLLGRVYLRGFEFTKSQPVVRIIDPGNVLLIEEDYIRLIMLAGEYEGDQAALERIQVLRDDIQARSTAVEASETESETEIDASDQLIADELIALETLYTSGIESLEPSQRSQLVNRYGYIGQFALTHGLDATDTTRAKLTSGFMPIVMMGLLMFMVIIFFPLAGLVLLVLGVVKISSGKMKLRNPKPAKGGSVFLETYALFVAGFLVISIATFFVSNSSMPELAAFSLLAQWLLLFTIFWGLVRGMRSRDWRQAIGLHTGEGVFKEIGCGILAYIASLPVYLVGVAITVILLFGVDFITQMKNGGAQGAPEPVTNPVFEMIAQGGIISTLLLFLLATTWAPIVEEAIFRGALFRHFRASMHWVFAAFISAVLFAYMHDYGPLMVAPLIALGFMFAFMREWRGSLIAPMTAHFLHNFSLMLFMITLVQLIKDPVI